VKAAGATVSINPEKPRKGAFVVTIDGDKEIVSLTDLVRPFPPLKNLNMDEVIKDVVTALDKSS